MTKYVAIYRDTPLAIDQTLVIRADGCTAYEVQQYARAALAGKHDFVFAPTGRDARPDVELRWTGDDANHGGTPNRRRLQHRRKELGRWGPWTDV